MQRHECTKAGGTGWGYSNNQHRLRPCFRFRTCSGQGRDMCRLLMLRYCAVVVLHCGRELISDRRGRVIWNDKRDKGTRLSRPEIPTHTEFVSSNVSVTIVEEGL